ncbi:MAG: Ig-like domain-containing protein [Gemmatimonadaceae bacterium]
MKTNSTTNIKPFAHAKRVPPGAVVVLLLLAGCAAGGAKIVGPTDAGTPSTPGATDTTGTTGTSGTPGTLSRIVVSADAAEVEMAGSLPLRAVALDAAGDTLSEAAFAWTSSDPSVATVDAVGMVTGVGPGNANITAAVDAVTSSAFALSVVAAPVATITVTAPSSSMTSLSTMQAQAVARDAAGNVLGGVTFSWASTNTGAASVSSSGLITAGLVGTTEIQALAGGVSSNGLTVNVAP